MRILLGVAVGLAATWLALVVALLVVRPRGDLLKEAIRLGPDVVRMLKRIATDGRLPAGVRVRLWLLFVYLAIPIDVIPDFIPVLGFADDAILIALVLRSVVRRAGPDAVRRHWPGTPDGLAVVWKLSRLDGAATPGPRGA